MTSVPVPDPVPDPLPLERSSPGLLLLSVGGPLLASVEGYGPDAANVLFHVVNERHLKNGDDLHH